MLPNDHFNTSIPPAGGAAPPRSGIPPPPPALQRHSARVSEHLRACAAARGGWLEFDRFMAEALYAPDLGYYCTPLPKFGRAGDFITAAQLGDWLARCLAQQCAEILAELGGGDLLEFGPGDGRLAADLLTALEALGQPPARYFLLEPSPDLQHRQRETLSQCAAAAGRTHWLTDLPRAGFRGVMLANEVLDSLPAMRFEIAADGRARVLGVAPQGDGFGWHTTDRPLPPPLQPRLAGAALAPGYRSEIGLQGEAWVRTVGERIRRGALLLLDYGFPQHEFYHPERREGTLMCHYRHTAHSDPFYYPGAQDISAHVDFTAIAHAGRAAGLHLAGYTAQAAFMLSLGVLDMLGAPSPAEDPRRALAASAQLNTLLQPHEMGELIKVMAFTRDYPHPLSGFSMQDRRARL